MLFFFTTISASKVRLFSAHELKKALRDTYIDASRVVWTLIDNDKLANQIARLVAAVVKYEREEGVNLFVRQVRNILTFGNNWAFLELFSSTPGLSQIFYRLMDA